MGIINRMLNKLDSDVSNMQQGLQPENLAFWYGVIIREARRIAPSHLKDKINAKQDPILLMKFNLDISKRAVKYFVVALNDNLDKMPYTTKLYFLKVHETLDEEVDKSLT